MYGFPKGIGAACQESPRGLVSSHGTKGGGRVALKIASFVLQVFHSPALEFRLDDNYATRMLCGPPAHDHVRTKRAGFEWVGIAWIGGEVGCDQTAPDRIPGGSLISMLAQPVPIHQEHLACALRNLDQLYAFVGVTER